MTINSGTNSYPTTALWGTNFNANIPATLGTNIFSVVAQDANTNLVTYKFQMTVSSLEGNRSFNYDANGNQLSDGQRIYQWDAENRLASVALGTNTYSFGYDFAGRRVSENLNGTLIKQTVWDVAGSSPIPLDERDGSGGIVERFYSQGEQQGGTNYFYFRDHLGSVRELVDGSGVVHAEYSYDPYGVVTKVSGDKDASFQYAGYYAHLGTGLNLTWYRAYDPVTGRWLSRDPLKNAERLQGANLYEYVGNSPLNWNDPMGLQVDNGDASRGILQIPLDIILVGGAISLEVWDILHSKKDDVKPGDSCPVPDKGKGKPIKGSPAKENPDDGSIWEPDNSGNGGKQWKRWPDRKSWERGDKPRSVWDDGRVRK